MSGHLFIWMLIYRDRGYLDTEYLYTEYLDTCISGHMHILTLDILDTRCLLVCFRRCGFTAIRHTNDRKHDPATEKCQGSSEELFVLSCLK